MFHSSKFQPRINPVYNDSPAGQIDRAQDLRASITLNRTKVKELGNSDLVCWKQGIPTNTVTVRQLEYGEMDMWQQLANTSLVDDAIIADDYKVALSDISVYLTDDIDIFRGTLWYPSCRVSTFALNIGDPDALIERTYTLTNENEMIFQNDNKYVIYLAHTSVGGAINFTIGQGAYDFYPLPVEDPDNSGNYFLRCYRYRSSDSTNTLLVEGTGYTYDDGLYQIDVADSTLGDVFTWVYTSDYYVSGSNPFTPNTGDLCAIKADECTIYLESSTTVSKLQSVSFDCNFDRLDIKEIGTTDVVAFGARDIVTTASLGQIVESWTVDEVLRGVAGLGYGKLNVREYQDDMVLKIKVYTDNTKATFKMGYRLNNLSPTSIDDGDTIDDYATRNITLEGDYVLVTSNEATLDA